MPRRRRLSLKKYDISAERYDELSAFARQYGQKKRRLKEISYISSPKYGDIHIKSDKSATERLAMIRAELSADIELIDACVADACGDDVGMIDILRLAVTSRIGYDKLGIVPACRSSFYKYRKNFFVLLDTRLKYSRSKYE